MELAKLSSSCFAMRAVMLLMKIYMLKLIYFQPTMYGVTFWENPGDSKKCIQHRKQNQNYGRCQYGESPVGNYLRNLIYFTFRTNSYYH